MVASLEGTTDAIFTREFLQTEQRRDDRVMAEGVDMSVAFVASQQCYTRVPLRIPVFSRGVVTCVSQRALFYPLFPDATGLQEMDEMDERSESGDFGFRVPKDIDPAAEGVQLGVFGRSSKGGFGFTLWVSGTTGGGLRYLQ